MRLTTRTLDPLIVDNTMLASAAHCSTLLVVEHLLGLRAHTEVAPLKSGAAAHDALAHWHTTRGDTAGALQVFEATYRPWSEDNVPLGDRLAWRNLTAVMASWFRRTPFETLPYTVEHVEVGFQVPLAPGIELVGMLDVLGRATSDGTWRVVEHKTTGSVTAWWSEQWKWASQLTGYLDGASTVLGEVVVGAYVNALEFKLIPASDRACKDHGTLYSECGPLHCNHKIIAVQRRPWQFEVWRASARALAHRLQRIAVQASVLFDEGETEGAWEDIQSFVQRFPQEGTFTGQCRFCTLKDFCDGGRRHRSLLVHHPWRPETRVTMRPEGAADDA